MIPLVQRVDPWRTELFGLIFSLILVKISISQ
jgi:hypothetical protein